MFPVRLHCIVYSRLPRSRPELCSVILTGERERREKEQEKRRWGTLKASNFFRSMSTTLQMLANKSALSPRGIAATRLGSKTVLRELVTTEAF
jgi:hypothetical protein